MEVNFFHFILVLKFVWVREVTVRDKRIDYKKLKKKLIQLFLSTARLNFKL